MSAFDWQHFRHLCIEHCRAFVAQGAHVGVGCGR
jgi:hypothetical protein